MQINKVTTKKYPDMIIVRRILDTDRLKDKAKSTWQRIGEVNDLIDDKIDYYIGKFVDIFG